MQTERITLQTDEQDTERLRHAADVLQRGGLVAFPTETVYGVGANAENARAVARLYEVKNRPKDRPMAYHLGDAGQAERLAAPLSRAAKKLMRLYWPGPLTLVVPAGQGSLSGALPHENSGPAQPSKEGGSRSFVGLRLPEHRVARQLLARTDAPVVATSANRSGAPEPSSADQVLDQLGGKIDLVIDAGPIVNAKPSTVVEVDDDAVRVLREGAVPGDDVLEAARMTLLFVCRGNTCRSPMAEALCRRELAGRGIEEIRVKSAGTAAMGTETIGSQAVQALHDLGLDLSGRVACPLTLEQIDLADRIYVMERAQRRLLLEMAPGAADRVTMLDPSGRDIKDPHGGSIGDYNLCRGELAACIEDLLSTL